MKAQDRLLVVDDSLTIRKLVEYSFRSTRCQVEFATSGNEGLAKGRLLRPQVILLDYVLPDMKGTDLCRMLAADAALRDVPIVVMSAKQSKLRELFREFPAVTAFVQKPFTAEDITSRVAMLLARAAPPSDEAAFAEKEAAAKLVYAQMSQQFARIPEWYARMGDANPAAYFGGKILSPALVDALLSALAPLARAPQAASAPAAPQVAPPSSSPSYREQLLDAVFERAPDFSRKVQAQRLSARERQVLSLIDGHRPFLAIVDRLAIKAGQALDVLDKLEALDLVRRVADGSSDGPGRATAPVVVMFEPDEEHFGRQLQRALRERAEPLDMIAVAAPEQVVGSVERAAPRLVLLNATFAGDLAASLAIEVRKALRGAKTKLVATLETRSSEEQASQLHAAGFDAVLCKPIPYDDIDALLSSYPDARPAAPQN